MPDLITTVLGASSALLVAAAETDSSDEAAEIIFGIIFYAILLTLPIIGMISGKIIESRHFKSLAKRETEFADITISDVKTPPADGSWQQPGLVNGSAVIATDYFKTFAASFRKLFGGEFKGLKNMQDRARREAILRMLAHARSLGATAVYNVRIETATIGGKSRKKVAGVEILAYGTALVPAPSASSPNA